MDLWLIIAAAVAAIVVVVAVVRQRRAAQQRHRRDQAMSAFAPLLPHLERAFLAAAAATGKPRGLTWTGCRLEDAPLFAVDRVNGELFALVNATVSFSATEGGGMEEVEAVSNLRAATAVFLYRNSAWETDGRVVFNLNPAESLNHYRESLEPAVPETA